MQTLHLSKSKYCSAVQCPKMLWLNNGTEASTAFANMAGMQPEEREACRKQLLKYCGLDTLAMVKVWEKLTEAVEGKP